VLELKATTVIGMSIEEASGKIRSKGVGDEEEDYALPICAARFPVTTVIGAVEPCPRMPDASIVYCSGRDRYVRLLPDARLVALPPELQVGPEYGLAVLKNAHPDASMLALTILSPAGQKVLADRGLRSVALPSD
jgi:hypothetical protein